MSEKKDRIDSILDQVQPERRTFLKRLVGGGALAILALPASSLLAQETPDGGDGKGKPEPVVAALMQAIEQEAQWMRRQQNDHAWAA